jgi:hypothetical protein
VITRELSLVHPLTVKGRPLSVLRWKDGAQSWEVLPSGAYAVRVEGEEEHEFVVPPAGVKYEKRARAQKTTAGAEQKKTGT